MSRTNFSFSKLLRKRMNRGNTMSFVFFDYAIIVSALFAFGPVSSADIRIPETYPTVMPENHDIMFVREGNNATLRCPQIFLDDHVRLFIDGDNEILLSERVSFHPNEGFKIKELTYKDAGLYRCTFESDHVTRTMRWFDINVQRSPRQADVVEIDESKLRHVIEGQNLKVNCSARISTSEGTAIGWRSSFAINGRHHRIKTRLYRLTEFDYTVIGEEMTIMNVSSEDAGPQSCCLQESSSDCTSVTTISLTIHKPSTYQNEADIDIVNISIQNGATATLPCPKKSNEDDIRLFIDNNYEVNTSDRVSYDATLGFKIRNFVIGDTAIYKCKVVDGKEFRTVKIFDVRVERGPRNLGQLEIDEFRLRHVVEGQTLRVNCTIEINNSESASPYWSTPPIINQNRILYDTYIEYKSDRAVISAELTLPNVSPQDSGVYRCHDSFGSSAPTTATALLTVHAKP